MLESDRWPGSPMQGARPQRLLFASTGTKDPDASDTLYIEAFAAPDTINTMPDKTLNAFADHGKVGDPMPADGGDCEQVFEVQRGQGIDIDALAAQAPEGRRRRVRQVVERAARDDQVGTERLAA